MNYSNSLFRPDRPTTLCLSTGSRVCLMKCSIRSRYCSMFSKESTRMIPLSILSRHRFSFLVPVIRLLENSIKTGVKKKNDDPDRYLVVYPARPIEPGLPLEIYFCNSKVYPVKPFCLLFLWGVFHWGTLWVFNWD